jgi:Pentapeptide repeats (8 copies)
MRGRLAAPGRWLARRAGWIALALAIAAFLLGCVLVFPRLLYPAISDRELDEAQVNGKDRIQLRSERLKLQNDARTTLLQGVGGAVVLLGAWFTYRQLVTNREQLRHAVESNRQQRELDREQLRVVEQGQITERFTRAVDQLGSDRLDVRLGGIYALERIARDSPDDRRAIAEILSSFLRQRAPWPPSVPGQYVADAPLDQIPMRQHWSIETQAALTVIGRGGFADRELWEHFDVRVLDLSSTDLRRMYLTNAHLEAADLAGVNLSGAAFFDTHLECAELLGANLQNAILNGCYMNECWLHSANLEGATLGGTDLRGAILQKTHLPNTDLSYSDLRGAVLIDLDLRQVNLDGVQLEGAEADKSTTWPDNFDVETAGIKLTIRD